jgi:signal transduction histidine kinase/AmiR/NasT family two-component response regulator
MSTENKMKHRAKIRGYFVLLLCFCLVLLSAAFIMQRQLMESARNANISVLDNFNSTETKELENYETVLKLCMNFMEEKEAEDASIEEINAGLYPYLDEFYDLYSGDTVKSFGMIGGYMISNMSEAELLEESSVDYQTKDWYKGAIEADGEVYVTDAYTDEENGKTKITMVIKAKNSDSILGFDIYFDNYHGYEGDFNLPENGDYYLCDKNGRIMYYTTELYDTESQAQVFADKIFSEIDSNSVYGYLESYRDSSGEVRSVYTRKMENGWTIFLTIPHKNAVGGMRTLYFAIGVLLFAGSILIVYMGIRDYRKEKINQQLVEERQNATHQAQIYQTAIHSTAFLYREIFYVDLDNDSCEMLYSQTESAAETTKYSEIIIARIEDGRIAPESKTEVEHFMNPWHIKRELRYKSHIELEYQRQCQDEYEWCVTAISASERDEKGVPTTVTVTIRSINDIIRKEEKQKEQLALAVQQAEAANLAKSDFFSHMSYDIRTPMNAIMGLTAIAAKHIDDKDRVQDALNKITLSGKHLMGLLDSLQDMSEIESGKISLCEEAFNLADSIESLLALMETQMVKKHLELTVNIAAIQHENVVGDDRRLQQIFVNIMENAIKFTPDGGKIILSIREKPSSIMGRGCYEFIFEDTGIGMEKELVEKVFEPFSRASDSDTTNLDGNGLGMSIAVNIAHMMGGDIQAESELGKGSRFTVTVYLKINDIREENLQMFGSLPILVVDDEVSVCVCACEVLNGMDMQAEYALSGDAAIKRIQEAHEAAKDFAVVILDFKMPDKDGLETAREIRKIMGEKTPILILSAYDRGEIEQEAALTEMDGFIEKPLFRSRLIHVLKNVIVYRQESQKKSEQETR